MERCLVEPKYSFLGSTLDFWQTSQGRGRKNEANRNLANAEAKVANNLTLLHTTSAKRDDSWTQQDVLADERVKLQVEKVVLKYKLNVTSLYEMVIEDYKMCEDFVDSTLDLIKLEIVDYL